MKHLVLLMCTSLVALYSHSADRVLSDTNILLGANNVEYNGSFYDVRFVDGTCADLYSGCDEASDFPTFDNGGNTEGFLTALISESQGVFTGIYNSNPTNTNGCTDPNFCLLNLPFDIITGGTNADAYRIDNETSITVGEDTVQQIKVESAGVLGVSPSVDTANFSAAYVLVGAPGSFDVTDPAVGMDIDGDGDTDNFDLLMIQRFLGGVSSLATNITLSEGVGGSGPNGARTNDELRAAVTQVTETVDMDIDGDTDSDNFDLLMIQRYLGGVSSLATNITLSEDVGGSGPNGARTNDELRSAVEALLGIE